MAGLICGAGESALGEETGAPCEKRLYQSSRGETLPYRLLSPLKIDAGQKYPLVLFLHGAGERGGDNEAQLRHVMPELAEPVLRERYPAFVIAPQCPENQQWVDIPWTAKKHTMPESPSPSLQLVRELLHSISSELPIDPDRVYVTGLSMGGFGAWDLLQRDPGPFAGAVIICGGGDPAFASRLKNVPVWVFHGDQDTVVMPERSRDMIQAIRHQRGRPIYTEYPGVTHNSWEVTARNRLVWDWLFSQQRASK